MNPAQGLVEAPSIESFFHRGASGGVTVWYTGVANQFAFSTQGVANNVLCMAPIVLAGGVIDTIAFETTIPAAAGGKARVGLYRNTSDSVMYPSTLVVDGGEFLVDAAAGVQSTSGLAIAITQGLYWSAYIGAVNFPTIRAFQATGQSPVMGMPTTMGATPNNFLFLGVTYGALPPTAPGGLTNVGGTTPLVAVHYAS